MKNNETELKDFNLKDSKCVCLHGLKVSRPFSFNLKINQIDYIISFIPYNEFCKHADTKSLINYSDIVTCDTVVVVNNCYHNLLEINIIKTAISILYFTNRMTLSDAYISHSIQEEQKRFSQNYGIHNDEIMKSISSSGVNGYFKNYHIDGYWGRYNNENSIEHASWIIKLGATGPNDDDFDMWLSRAYGDNLCDLYDRRDGVKRCIQLNAILLNIDDEWIKRLEKILNKISYSDAYSNKLISAFKLYYSLLCDYSNHEMNDIFYCTILESLLLGKDEDSQRKKAAVRAACVVANMEDIDKKKFIANQVYYFYLYRNSFIHDGKSVLDYDEHTHRTVHQGIKHIIFYIIKHIIDNDTKTHKDIIDLVKQNMCNDSIMNAFDYIDYDYIDNGKTPNIFIYND